MDIGRLLNNMKQDAFKQLDFLFKDYISLAGSKKMRMFYLWMSRAFIGVLLYRIERMMYLLVGKYWKLYRILFMPILFPFYAYSNCEISYSADIGPGIKILHPSMGVVISGFATIGKNLSLVGGNVIGGKPDVKRNKIFILGDNINIGANAVILGPIKLGNNVNIGASALVNKSFSENAILVGVPAQNIK